MHPQTLCWMCPKKLARKPKQILTLFVFVAEARM
jgi:hypothetical protein